MIWDICNCIFLIALVLSYVVVQGLDIPNRLSKFSSRIESTERPHIEDVLDKYSSLSNITVLALGSSYWTPPENALKKLIENNDIYKRDIHRYSNIQGLSALRDSFSNNLVRRGLNMDNMDVMVTAGANQASMNTFLALVDEKDVSILLAPYYFSHKLALQLCGSDIHVCPFNPVNLKPDWDVLENMVKSMHVKVMVVTNPNNPSGVTWSEDEMRRLIELCKLHNIWLVCDQTYHDFYYDGASHIYPCKERFHYDRIIHLFSASKAFGMPGWRVGYLVHPSSMAGDLRKIQDTIPTHASTLSQQLAIYCIQEDELRGSSEMSWVQEKIAGLSEVREGLWSVLQSYDNACKTKGAFYFLVPLPPKISEEEAVDILAKQFGILLMYGWPFGAPGYLRLSYGSISPERSLAAIDNLRLGLDYLNMIAKSR